MDIENKDLKTLNKEQLDEVVGGAAGSVSNLSTFTYKDGDEILINFHENNLNFCKFWKCKRCGGSSTVSKNFTSASPVGIINYDHMCCTKCVDVTSTCLSCAYIDKRSAGRHDRCQNPAVMNAYQQL